MKKQYTLGLALFLSVAGFSQMTPTFGVRAGVISSGLRGDAVTNLGKLIDLSNDAIETKNHTSFYGGMYAALPLSETVSVEPGIFYAQKGYQLRGNVALNAAKFLGVTARADLNSHYIDVPVVVKANLGGFQVFAGPQVSYLAKANFQARAGVLGINLLNKSMDVTNQFNRWDGSVTGGVGYQFANGVNLSAAYEHGLSQIDAGKRTNSFNKAVKVGVGFRF